MSHRLRAEAARRRRDATVRALGGVAVATLLVALVWPMVVAPPALISCAVCQDRFDAYHAHLTNASTMAATPLAEVEAHLAHCVDCRRKFEARYPGVLSLVSSAGLLAPAWFALAWGSRRRGR